MPRLVIEQPGIPAMSVEITDVETTFGRADDCTVALVAEEISRYHAKVVLDGDQTLLYDLKSLNGTYVNKQRIVQRLLGDNDEVWFGSKCKAVFYEDPPETLERRKHESSLKFEVKKIANDMDDLTQQLTMIGRRSRTTTDKTVAVSVSPEMEKTRRAFRRLNAVYKATKLIASEFDLQRRMSEVLDLALEEMGAERGFLLLREGDSDKLTVQVARDIDNELKASSPSMGIAHRAAIDGEPVLMMDPAKDSKFGGRESIIRQRISAAMCVPLQIENRTLGSLYIDTRDLESTFNEEDLELFQTMANQAAMAIENVRLHEAMVAEEKRRANLSRFLSPGIVEHLLSEEQEIQLGGEKRIVTILFCDIRGFTPLSEGLAPDRLVELLNQHFTAMTDIIFEHRGTLDKYIGDAVMALFGTPFAQENDATLAARAGLAMQLRNDELNLERSANGLPPFELGVGINTGEVYTGYIGSPDRLDFTVIGDHVNVASRLCSVASGGKVLVGQGTYERIQDIVDVRSAGTPVLKGKTEQVNAYELIGFKNLTPIKTSD